jgi:glucokinase
MSSVIALDIGGTTLKGARCVDGAPLDVWHRRTPAGGDAVLRAVLDLAAALRTEDTSAAGVVTPGVLDTATGVVRFAANLGWRDVALGAALQAALGLPVVVGHDVAAAAQVEAAELGADDLLYVALGTGIAAAHVVGGTARRGHTGAAGELGHIVAVTDGEPCPCGRRGCLERYASGAAISRRYAAVRRADALPDRAAADAQEIAARAATEPLAQTVWTDAAAALGAALATATTLLDPAVVVLGGGVAGAGDVLLAPVEKALAAALPWREPPPVRLGVLGSAAGVRGAARLARALGEASP